MDYAEIEKKIAAYEGPKVAIVVTGGGQGIAQLSTIVGVSKLLHAILIPYSYDESVKLIGEALGPAVGEEYRERAVCEKSARLLCLGGMKRWAGCRVIACTAATTTSRWRRGENQAYIAVGEFRPGEDPAMVMTEHHLKLSKLTEKEYHAAGADYIAWKRRQEDREVTNFILDLIFGGS